MSITSAKAAPLRCGIVKRCITGRVSPSALRNASHAAGNWRFSAIQQKNAAAANLVGPWSMSLVTIDLARVQPGIGQDIQIALESPVENLDFLRWVLLWKLARQPVDGIRPRAHAAGAMQASNRTELPVNNGAEIYHRHHRGNH